MIKHLKKIEIWQTWFLRIGRSWGEVTRAATTSSFLSITRKRSSVLQRNRLLSWGLGASWGATIAIGTSGRNLLCGVACAGFFVTTSTSASTLLFISTFRCIIFNAFSSLAFLSSSFSFLAFFLLLRQNFGISEVSFC
jgi:hypothetical protein